MSCNTEKITAEIVERAKSAVPTPDEVKLGYRVGLLFSTALSSARRDGRSKPN